jgi:hypothetical protein
VELDVRPEPPCLLDGGSRPRLPQTSARDDEDGAASAPLRLAPQKLERRLPALLVLVVREEEGARGPGRVRPQPRDGDPLVDAAGELRHEAIRIRRLAREVRLVFEQVLGLAHVRVAAVALRDALVRAEEALAAVRHAPGEVADREDRRRTGEADPLLLLGRLQHDRERETREPIEGLAADGRGGASRDDGDGHRLRVGCDLLGADPAHRSVLVLEHVEPGKARVCPGRAAYGIGIHDQERAPPDPARRLAGLDALVARREAREVDGPAIEVAQRRDGSEQEGDDRCADQDPAAEPSHAGEAGRGTTRPVRSERNRATDSRSRSFARK